MGSRQLRLQFERLPVAADSLIVTARLRERDRHVLEHAMVVRLVTQRETIRRQGGVVVALSFEHERFVQVIEALWLDLTRGLAAEDAAPPGHAVGIGG